MRFEIRAGGALLILIGLAGLSGVVFALGLVAGYEMARQTSPEGAQVANVYPLPGAPQNAESSPAPSPAEASLAQPPSENPAEPAPAQPMAASSPGSAPSVAQSKPAPPPAPKPIAKASPPAPALPKNTAAAETQPRSTIPPSRPVESAENASDESETPPAGGAVAAPKYASASVPSPGHRQPFNIQIDAVMDYANAQQMVTRLQKLGYHAFLVPTDIDGQRWWRVRVGPFGSAEEAQTAEQELRNRYRSTYTH